MKHLLVELIAGAVQARLNCLETKNVEWEAKHETTINKLVQDHLPSGGGFDNGTQIDLERSTADKLVFTTAFHHMNEGGFYDGWTEHDVVVKPSFIGRLSIDITGKNRNDIKEYIHESFHAALTEEHENV
jgi:hypothetical protein